MYASDVNYDRVARHLIYLSLMKKGLLCGYIQIIRDMSGGAFASVKTMHGVMSKFPIGVGLH